MKKRKKPVGLIIALVVCGGIIVKMTLPAQASDSHPVGEGQDKEVPSKTDLVSKTADKDATAKGASKGAAKDATKSATPVKKPVPHRHAPGEDDGGPTIVMDDRKPARVKPNDNGVIGQWYSNETHLPSSK